MEALKHLFFTAIFPWVPKRFLSRLTGWAMRIPLGPLSPLLIPLFARLFGINMAEAEHPPGQYRSFNAFFTRRLRPGVRPVQGPRVHPADSVLTQTGPIVQGHLVQAKGWTYDLGEFLGDPQLATAYEGGTFATYYLCPADYHRVHAPCTGQLVSAQHIPGLLWPVNSWSVHNVERLFNLNERVVLNFSSPEGRWSLVLVGATNVGQMSITPDPSIATNRWFWAKPTRREYLPAINIQAGDELGIFHLGSTVICSFEKTMRWPAVQAGPVKVGSAI